MGMGEASGEKRVLNAAVATIANPLIEEPSIKWRRQWPHNLPSPAARTLTLFEVDEAATGIREEADPDANIIVGANFDGGLRGGRPRLGGSDRH